MNPRTPNPEEANPVEDPYKTLELSDDADDEAIRRRYLELVKRYPPEHHPEKFAAVRAAYESLRDLTTRVRHRLLEAGSDSLDAIIQELACPKSRRRRMPLQALLSLARRP
jgi:curved DNA-binding protein CbpA